MPLLSYRLDPRYLAEPTLLMRPINAALSADGASLWSITLVLHSGSSQEYRLDLEDRLEMEDMLRMLIKSNELEAIILHRYCTQSGTELSTAVVHIATEALYAQGEGASIAPFFERVLPLESSVKQYDHSATEIWKRRYPESIEL